SIHRVDGPRSAGTKSTGPALQNGGNRAPEVSVGSECACFPIEPGGPLVRNRKSGKHEVPDHKVRDEGAARPESEEGPATQSGHLFHRDDRSGSPDRGSSDDNGSHSRGPYTQPPIPTLPLSMDRAVEGPEIAGREHDDAGPRKMCLCAPQPQGFPQVAEKMFRTNDELGLFHRTTAYSRRAPSPSRSIRSKRRRGAASSEVTPWPPASVGAAWPPSTLLLTKTFSSSARPFRRKDQMTVLPPSTRIVFTSRAARRSRRACKSTSSLPRRMTSAPGNERSLSSDVTINVGALPSNTWAESGILPSESKITRRGFRPFAYSDFTVNFGSSFRTVPTPTRIASTAARRRCTRRRSSSLLNRTPFPSGCAIFPSTLIAALMITRGRTAIRWDGRITTLRVRSEL